jgi:hypothetical protein
MSDELLVLVLQLLDLLFKLVLFLGEELERLDELFHLEFSLRKLTFGLLILLCNAVYGGTVARILGKVVLNLLVLNLH